MMARASRLSTVGKLTTILLVPALMGCGDGVVEGKPPALIEQQQAMEPGEFTSTVGGYADTVAVIAPDDPRELFDFGPQGSFTLVDESRLLFASNGDITVVDALTGVGWRVADPFEGHDARVSVLENRIYAAAARSRVLSFDLSTGEQLERPITVAALDMVAEAPITASWTISPGYVRATRDMPGMIYTDRFDLEVSAQPYGQTAEILADGVSLASLSVQWPIVSALIDAEGRVWLQVLAKDEEGRPGSVVFDRHGNHLFSVAQARVVDAYGNRALIAKAGRRNSGERPTLTLVQF